MTTLEIGIFSLFFGGMKSISETHFLESFFEKVHSGIIHPRLLSEKMRGKSVTQPVVQLFPFELV